MVNKICFYVLGMMFAIIMVASLGMATDSISPNITIKSPASGVNVSSGNITFSALVNGTGTNVSYVEITNISNGLLPYIYNLSSGANSANCINVSATNETLNCTIVYPVGGLQEGANTISVLAYDSGGNSNSTNITFNVDRTGPVITVNGPASSSYSKSSTVVFNITASDATTAVSACWVNLNGTTNYLAASGSNLVYSWSSLVDYTWSVNYTCNDSMNNPATIATYTFKVDTKAPAIPNITMGTPSTSGVTIYYTSNESINTVNITYGTDSSISLGSTTNSDVGAVSGNKGISGLSSNTRYYFNITVCDYAGNCATNGTFDFRTQSSSSNDDDDGGGNPATSYWFGTFVVTDAQLEEGYTKEVQNHYRLQIKINNATHYVGVVNVSGDRATINVSSTPQQAVLYIGESKKFEVTGDYYYDVLVSLLNVSGSKAKISVKYIHDALSANEIAALNQSALLPPSGKINLTNSSATGGKFFGGMKWWMWMIIGIIIVAAGTGGALYYLYLKNLKKAGYQ